VKAASAAIQTCGVGSKWTWRVTRLIMPCYSHLLGALGSGCNAELRVDSPPLYVQWGTRGEASVSSKSKRNSFTIGNVARPSGRRPRLREEAKVIAKGFLSEGTLYERPNELQITRARLTDITYINFQPATPRRSNGSVLSTPVHSPYN
jgi:hypothetical protein